MSRPAPRLRRVRAQAVFETLSVLRNGEQLLVSLILPALALIALATTPVLGSFGEAVSDERRLPAALAGAIALAVSASAFTGQAIATAFDRRYGVLRRLATTPLGVSGLISGKLVAVVAVVCVQVVVLGSVALALEAMGAAPPAQWAGAAGNLAAVPIIIAGTAALLGLGLLLAGTLRAEAVLAGANILWVFAASAGGVVIAHAGLWGHLASALPFGALGAGMRAALIDGRLDVLSLAVLLGWSLLMGLACRRWFSFG